MSDEFEPDNFGAYAADLMVTKLDPGGEPLFSVGPGKITFHKSGVYEINVPATVRRLEDTERSDGTSSSELAALLTEVCRYLRTRAHPWAHSDQQDMVSTVVAALPQYFPDGVLMVPGELVDRRTRGDHMRVVLPDGPDEEEPSPEIQRVAHLGIARSWALDGTLSLDELVDSLKDAREDKAPLGRPTAPRVVTSDGKRRTDEQDLMVASGVTTMVARQDGLLPEVYVTHQAGGNLPVRVLREAGPKGQIATSVMLFQNSGTPSVDTLQGINRAFQANSEKLVRELGKAQGDLRAEREISAELRTRLDTALGNLAEVNTTANDRQRTIETLRRWALLARQTLHYQARWIEEAYEIREGDAADREQLDRTLRNAIKIMREVDAKHPDSPNVGQVAPPDTTQLSSEGVDDTTQRDVPPNEFFKVVDGNDKTPAVWVTHSGDGDVPVTVERTARDHGSTVLLRLHNMGRAPHERDGDVPWSLRQWALLARQTMEQQALQLGEIKSGHGVTWGMVDRTVAHANKMLREAVAEYPEDLDAVQAEQATRNADEEAVRRLAHAMTEVANQLDSPALDVIPNVRLDSEKLIHLVRKLRGTVETWTTGEQRRPWAQASQGEPAAWWIDHAGCRHSVDGHRTQRDGGGCQATDCDCKASTDGLRHQHDLMEASESQAPGGDAGADWAPGVVFRDVLKALHLAEWLTRHLRGSVPSDYIGPNNELNRSVRRLLGLAD